MGPIDYSTQVANPFMQALQGYQGGAAIRDDQAQQAQIEQQRQAQVQQQQVLRGLISNPSATAADYSNVGLMFPALAKPLADSWAVRSADQQAADKDRLGQMFAALSSGNPKVAAALATRHAEALKGGTNAESAQQAQTFAQLVEMDPGLAKALVGMKLAAGPGGKELIESIAKLGGESRAAEQGPAELRKKTADAAAAEAEARIKAIAAKYGEQSAVAELAKKGWEIRKFSTDEAFKREELRIQAIGAAAARETNALKRQELQMRIDDARRTLDDKAREKVAEAEGRIGGVVDARTLIREVKDLGIGWATGITAGSSLMPGSDARTVAGKITQLQNILTLDYLDKLKGPTSDNDIKFLKGIASNLDRWQSTGKFGEELEKVDAALARVDAAVRKKYGMPPALKPSNPAPAAPQAPAGAAGAAGPTVSGW